LLCLKAVLLSAGHLVYNKFQGQGTGYFLTFLALFD
jgi:hypothetical protein